MLSYSIKITGQPISNMTKKVKSDIQTIQNRMVRLGYKTVEMMKNNIQAGVKRKASGNLAYNMGMTLIPGLDSIFIGIGNISELNSKAPYWYVVNYGARYPGSLDVAPGAPYIPPVTRGYFEGSPRNPDGSLSDTQRNQDWVTRKNGKYYMVPKKAIRPSNYIEKTKSWLNNYWDIFWSNI